MNIRNVGNFGNVERSGERKQSVDPQRTVLVPAKPRDDARISESSRELASAVEGLAERARRGDGDREARVEVARQKLLGGQLDAPEVLGATARRLLDARFLDA